jgi:protein-disulfide isomerase
VALVLALAGAGVSVVLTRLHADAHAGIASFCAISDVVNCDRVATSPYSVFLGLPVSVWGLLGFGVAAALAASGLVSRRPHPGWPRGLLLVIAALATAVSIVLAIVSKTVIGAWCILCAAGWALSAGLLATAWRACRVGGVREAVALDLRALAARPVRAIELAVLAAAAVALAATLYPRYWEKTAAANPQAPPAAIVTATDPGPGVVVEYSDYLCPFCARMHEQERAARGAHAGVKVLRRHFPLDPTCNPVVKRVIHPGACDAARAGVCAEAQGRFDEMNDALFANQKDRVPVRDVARRLGLDLARFDECLAAPSTQGRLDADIAAAIRDNVRATPTYVVPGGRVYAGALPPELGGTGQPPAPPSPSPAPATAPAPAPK